MLEQESATREPGLTSGEATKLHADIYAMQEDLTRVISHMAYHAKRHHPTDRSFDWYLGCEGRMSIMDSTADEGLELVDKFRKLRRSLEHLEKNIMSVMPIFGDFQ